MGIKRLASGNASAGATLKDEGMMKTPSMDDDKKISLKVKWKVLEPIMAVCNNQTHKMDVIPQDPDKGLRKIECNGRPMVPNRFKIG